ncbi:MAG: AmmeMemoRadiSam system protein A, partial [Gammaproteobacteria bacterium]|nr:AmmeMemoRadiSam system protein A [Gammaproteobacteria bacterium]
IDYQLRGCIGSLEAHQSLVTDLNQNAFAAAFQDPRFPALSRDELKSIHLHISVLNQAQPMSFTSEDDLLNQLRVGVDGLIIQDKHRRATFLPAVWESLTDKKQFLTQLKLKAGMTADHWSDNFKAWRYQSFSISEEAL